jgi:hypothetical protein
MKSPEVNNDHSINKKVCFIDFIKLMHACLILFALAATVLHDRAVLGISSRNYPFFFYR